MNHRRFAASIALVALATVSVAVPMVARSRERTVATPTRAAHSASAVATATPPVPVVDNVDPARAAVLVEAPGDVVAAVEDAVATAPVAPRTQLRPGQNPLDLPMREAWPATNQWNDTFERDYSAFVLRLGRAIRDRHCGRLDRCLANPQANALYVAEEDANLRLEVDCADLPYILRAYFAYKRRLPFGWVSAVSGIGSDPRYMLRVRPAAYRAWTDFATPRALFRHMGDDVHSGMYRSTPTDENNDFYPTKLNREAVRPGTVFYDPNGHVLVVVEVRPDGLVTMVDGHPDGSLTYKRFGQAFTVGTASMGGGFKNFRPLTLAEGTGRERERIHRAMNASLTTMHGGREQFDYNRGFPMGMSPAYAGWVRTSLSVPGANTDPTTEFREQVRALCRDVRDRADAVDFALAARVHQRSHPSSLPENIYGTSGDWETYSTPSRDARLKAAFRELRATVQGFDNLRELAPQLQVAWREETARPECSVHYADSSGAQVGLTMDQVLDRIYQMSFDPYHCPELRWGAQPGSYEARACADDPGKLRWYTQEQRLRNRIDREYGRPTGLDFGPETAEQIDVRVLLRETIAGTAPSAAAPSAAPTRANAGAARPAAATTRATTRAPAAPSAR